MQISIKSTFINCVSTARLPTIFAIAFANFDPLLRFRFIFSKIHKTKWNINFSSTKFNRISALYLESRFPLLPKYLFEIAMAKHSKANINYSNSFEWRNYVINRWSTVQHWIIKCEERQAYGVRITTIFRLIRVKWENDIWNLNSSVAISLHKSCRLIPRNISIYFHSLTPDFAICATSNIHFDSTNVGNQTEKLYILAKESNQTRWLFQEFAFYLCLLTEIFDSK